MWSVAAGGDYPTVELEALWKTLLLNQFHDILPGSSIDWVYEEAERDLQQVTDAANAITHRATSAIAGDGERLAVFNPNSHARREVIDLDGFRMVEARPCGWTVNTRVSDLDAVSVTSRSMENALLRVEVDDRGLLTSIWDKESEREVLSGPGNLLQLFDDNPARWDAWDLDATYRDSVVDLTEVSSLEVESNGPLRATLGITRIFGSSLLRQRMVLDAGSRVLRFESVIEWHEEHKLLKVAFPVTVSSPVGSSRVDLQACKLEYSIVSPK